MAEVLRLKLLRGQRQLFESRKREVLYSGSFGAAKSRGLCYALLKHAVIPGNLVALARKTLTDLRATTLRTLLQPDGHLPPVLPEGSYVHRPGASTIDLNGGGAIYYLGFGVGESEMSARKARSLNLGGVFLDEAIEFTEDEYMMFFGRLRNPVDPFPQIVTATNPGGPQHFLYKRFCLGDPASLPSDRQVIFAKTSDNPFLPREYVNSLESLSGTYHERYVRGRWVGFEGAVYPAWSERCIRRLVIPGDAQPSRVWAAVDPGFTNPFCILVFVEFQGAVYVVFEHYGAGLTAPDQEALCSRVYRRFHPEIFYVDPEDPALAQALRNRNILAKGANNQVLGGIGKVQRRVAGGRLFVDPSCVHLIEQMSTYAWRPGKDEPVKQNDHAVDALRYGVATVDSDFRFDVETVGAPTSQVRQAALGRVRRTREREREAAAVTDLGDAESRRPMPEPDRAWLTADNDEVFR